MKILDTITLNRRFQAALKRCQTMPHLQIAMGALLRITLAELAERGVALQGLVGMLEGGLSVSQPQRAVTENSSTGVTLVSALFASSMAPFRQETAGSSKPDSATLEGAKVEETRTAFLLFTPPDLFSKIIAAPRLMTSLRFGKWEHFSYRLFAIKHQRPIYTVQSVLTLPQIQKHFLHSYPSTDDLTTLFYQAEDPGFQIVFPFWTAFEWHGRAEQTMRSVKVLSPPWTQETCRLALYRQGSIYKRSGLADDAVLTLARPAETINGLVVQAVVPLGKYRAESVPERNFRRIIFLLFFLLMVLLAFRVGHRVLQPVMSFTQAAQMIMTGNFSVRLPQDRDDEFGLLANSFNNMAAGIEEGRRLRRYVSDSVKIAAQDSRQEETARQGESLEAVILFSGITRFKTLLATIPPADLVERLNLNLQTMSREIREHGGEIDKFIGDKILAVFHPKRLGGMEAAMSQALEAGRAMFRHMHESPIFPESELGIGLVSGPVLAGIMGTPEVRLEYTVIGDTVNLASRLCDLALKNPGGGIILAEEISRFVTDHPLDHPGIRVTPLSTTSVKGKSREIRIYSLDSAP